ncbi:MAG: cysteine dioxygenase family protein [Candidatus Eisenbacteria bacterium]
MESSCLSTIADPLTLEGVRDALLTLPHPFRREDVHRVVSRLRVDPASLRRYQHWSDERYTRTRFYEGERFEILVLCWKEGQTSPIHDHAQSICTMVVLEGAAVTTMYEVVESADAPGRRALVEESTGTLPAGALTTVYGGDIHRVGNPKGSGSGLMTIHFYLPPIPEMLVWDEGDPTPRTCRAITLDPEPA